MFPDAKCHHSGGRLVLGSLIVLSLFRVCQLCQLVALQRAQKINVRLLWGKLAILALISLISVANIVVISIDSRWVTFFPFLVLEAIAFLALLLLTYMSHTRTRRSSTTALLFWLAYFAALLIWSRTTLGVARSPPPLVFALRWSIGALGLIAFALECLGPEYCSEPDTAPRMNAESPLLMANIFGVWTFGWLTPLIKKGARQFITEDNLPELVPEDEASKLVTSVG
ncbi:hypothetical protein EDB89DRAFT_433842 [Lactarius sanguifluus]|nr:hypothetical protein EDB89DRAFT_433842 [Lactarius sanguifluus]